MVEQVFSIDLNIARIEFDSVTYVIFEILLIEWAL